MYFLIECLLTNLKNAGIIKFPAFLIVEVIIGFIGISYL